MLSRVRSCTYCMAEFPSARMYRMVQYITRLRTRMMLLIVDCDVSVFVILMKTSTEDRYFFTVASRRVQ